ncbi:MAG TPA: acetolactate synthase small subunit, partial [Acidobacteriaceae bacterium]|nr:acetolactate synthase small subunit [Acidobacteriaceae bacterium]
LEVSRTGRMAMRRGHHTSRVLKALGTPTEADPETDAGPDLLDMMPEDLDADDDKLLNQFEDDNA